MPLDLKRLSKLIFQITLVAYLQIITQRHSNLPEARQNVVGLISIGLICLVLRVDALYILIIILLTINNMGQPFKFLSEILIFES